jgi:uncharacterized protein DUF4333
VSRGTRQRSALGALALAGVVALLGCGTAKLETGKIEVAVKKDLADRTGTRVASVKCPDDVEARKGDKFRCTAIAARGERVAIEVLQEDGQGRVTWRLVGAGSSSVPR